MAQVRTDRESTRVIITLGELVECLTIADTQLITMALIAMVVVV